MQAALRRNILLAGLFLGLFFAALDQTVVGTAMPRIIGDLGGLSIMTWVTTAYMLSSTTIVPIAGKLADLYGRRIIYVSGILLFMAGSALCGLSQNMTQLILFRGLQGIGGGIMMPLAMTIVGDVFPPEKRGKWQGLIGAVFGVASIIGPALGGWIVDYSSWHWVFYVNLPIGFLAAGTIYIGLHGEKVFKDQAIIDYAGAVSLIVGTVCLLVALNLGGTDYPWLSWPIILLLGISFSAWIAFILVERKAKEPLLSLELFNNKIFTIANTLGFLMGLGMFGAFMFLPLFFQGVLGLSATRSGNTMIAMMFANIGASIIGGQLINKVGIRPMFVTGMAAMTAGLYLLSTMTLSTSEFVAITYMIVLGFGMGLIMPTVTLAVQSAFPAEQRGVATSATQFFRSIGGTLGMTVLGVLFNNYSLNIMNRDFFPQVEAIPELQYDPLNGILTKAHSDPHSLFNLLLSPTAFQSLPVNLQQAILAPLRNALSESLQVVFLAAMLITLIGVAISLFVNTTAVAQKVPNSQAEAAGITLFAEGIGVEGEISAELVPNLIADDKSSHEKAIE